MNDMQCACEEGGRAVEDGFFNYHWYGTDEGWLFRCRENATQEDGRCDYCRAGHPEPDWK